MNTEKWSYLERSPGTVEVLCNGVVMGRVRDARLARGICEAARTAKVYKTGVLLFLHLTGRKLGD